MAFELTRRAFLERATCMATVMAATTGRAAPSAQATGWFVSLNGALTRGVSGADKIKLAAATGYGGVDWDFSAAKTAGLEATQALFRELKIEPTIVNLPMARPLPFAGDEAAFREALKPLADDAAFIAAVGCRKMMVVLPPTTTVPRGDQMKLVRDRFAAIGEVLQRSRIRIGLEFLGPLYFREGRPDAPPVTPFVWTLRDTLALATECGPNVGVILDAWHWHHSGSTVDDILAAQSSRIVHIHVSDAKAAPPADVRDNQRVLPGEGIIDLVGFFGALKRIGYADGVSPEPLGRIPADMPVEAAARLGLETAVAILKKSGVTVRA